MDAIRFGLFDHLEKTEAPLTQLYEERLGLLADADRAGFFCYHLAEHQATPLGMAPSPGIFLAAVVERTRRLHLGPLVYLLPLYNPLRLVNEICMLDQMSGGRFEAGVGRGISPYELAYFRVPFYESREMFEESLQVIVAGLRNPRLTHRGPYYHFDGVPMELAPQQRPNPPFWYGTATEGSVLFAARHNMHMVGNGPNSMLRKLSALYHEERARHLNGPENLNPGIAEPTIGAIRHVYVGDNEREVEEIGRPAFRVFYNNLMKLWRDNRVVLPHFIEDLGRATKVDVAMSGTPAQVQEQVGRFFDSSGCNYLVLAFAWGSLNEVQYRRSFELFTTRVMPEFTKRAALQSAAAG